MSLLPSGAIESAGYDINNSLRFRASASAYLNRTPASAGNRQIYTYSTWVKLGSLSLGTQQFLLNAGPASDNERTQFTIDSNLVIGFVQVNGGSVVQNLTTTQVLRDPSAWYHIVLAVDTTQATASNRAKLYINGSQVTAFSTATYMAQNTNTYINNTTPHFIGKYENGSGNPSDWYQAESILVDGQALTPSSFGETDSTTGVWKPKAYTGTYGTNGFYLKFSDIATTSGSNAGLGKDFSGNTNYWTTNNISVTSGTTYDAMKDSPTNTSATVANYCTLNPLTFGGTVSEANLRAASAGTDYKILGTLGVSSGKWYWEIIANNAPGGDVYGVANLLTPTSPTDTTSLSVAGTFARVNTGTQWYENGTLLSKSISTVSAGGIIQFALDVDNQKIWVGINGTWQASGDPAAGTNPISSNLTAGQTWFPYLQFRSSTSNISANFGQRPFSYTPPTGYVALNTYNLPDSTIKKGSQYFNTVLYTGNGSTNAITGVGFSPDFVWVKNRAVAEHNCLYDSVRGVYKQLYSNLTNVEDNATNSLTSFDSDGFTLANNTTPNTNGNAHVSWNWRGSDSSAVSNTSGTITSTVSVNATAGFSVVTYTGTGANATVGHGLGVAPAMVIVKRRTGGTGNWNVRHVSITAANSLYLNLTNASQSDPTVWNSTVPTSTVFSIGTDTGVNASASTYVAYCWAEIAGFSRFGSYTGNGSADGPFIFTGFRPKFILTKKTNGAGDDWTLFDTARNTYNLATLLLRPNSSVAELSSSIDILSNGFKWRQGGGNGNETSGTYIYMAFAENPFKNALAR